MNYQGTSTRKPLMIVVTQEYQIKYVGWGPPPERLGRNDTKLEGTAASLLYVALSGHDYDQEPEAADRQRAIQARRALASIRTEGTRVALLVLAFWGTKIKPWLGKAKLVDQKPRFDLPEYELEISLEMPSDMPKIAGIVTV